MIRMSYRVDRNRGQIRMLIHGHAGTAPKGQDLVCAAATILGATAAQKAKDLQTNGMLQREPKIVTREGTVKIVLEPNADAYDLCVLVLSVIGTGFRLLEADYPDAVKVTIG